MAITYTGDWGVFEAALVAWVTAASGLATGKVVRAEQDGPRPAAPFAEVRIGDVRMLGAVDATTETYDGASVGTEITQTVRGQREFAATVRFFTTSAVGSSSARALLGQVQAALGLPSVRDALHTAGLTVTDAGTIQTLPSVLDTRWEGRATLTARFYCEVTASEKTTLIESVELTDQVPDPDVTFTVGP